MKNNEKLSGSKVTVIIVTYNGVAYIGNCIESIIKGKTVPNIIIVDNNSEDKTIQVATSIYDKIKVIKLAKNYGFGYANNVGINYALENHKSNYFFLLNQDTKVFPDSISTLLEVAAARSEFGIISPTHLMDENKLDPNFEKYINAGNDYFAFNRSDNLINEVPMINAAAWFVSRDCIESVGGFDTSMFFHYGEDENYCQRVLFHGFKIGFTDSSRIVHFRSNTRRKNDPVTDLDMIMLKKRISMINVLIPDEAAYSIYRNYLFTAFLIFVKSILLLNFNKTNYIAEQLIEGNIFIRRKIANSRNINKQKGLNWLAVTSE